MSALFGRLTDGAAGAERIASSLSALRHRLSVSTGSARAAKCDSPAARPGGPAGDCRLRIAPAPAAIPLGTPRPRATNILTVLAAGNPVFRFLNDLPRPVLYGGVALAITGFLVVMGAGGLFALYAAGSGRSAARATQPNSASETTPTVAALTPVVSQPTRRAADRTVATRQAARGGEAKTAMVAAHAARGL